MANMSRLLEESKEIGGIVSVSRRSGSRFKNPAQIIFDEKNLDFFRKACGLSKHTVEGMSDYEKFSMLMENLHLIVGSGLYEYAERLLRGCHKREPRELWSELSDKIDSGMLEGDKKNKCPCHFPEPSVEESFEEHLSGLYKINSKEIFVDISSLKFKKSDLYHTEKAYSDLLADREYDRDIILCGRLYSFCEHFKNSNICLLLYVGDNIRNAELLVDYFLQRGVMPRARLICFSEVVRQAAEFICGVSETRGREVEILCGLGYRACDTSLSLSEEIKKLVAVYPVGKLKLYGSKNENLVYSVFDEIMRHGLCRALSDVCENYEDAVAAVSAVLRSE